MTTTGTRERQLYQDELVQSAKDRVRLYLAEEQQILREAYRSFFFPHLGLPHPDLEVVGISGDTSGEALITAASALKPDVMLLGIKALQPTVVEKLEMVRESCPDLPIVLLSAYYGMNGIQALRRFARGSSIGCAYLLKHTVDTVEQLTQVVHAVAEGRIIVDSTVMEELIATTDTTTTSLKELSPRELEVLSWMAKGYRNGTIADVLCLEPKTVERHINSIYSKLSTNLESKHQRVHAVTMYLKATGLLPAGDTTSA